MGRYVNQVGVHDFKNADVAHFNKLVTFGISANITHIKRGERMQTLKNYMKRKALNDIKSSQTVKQYKKNINRFSEWAKEKHHIRMPKDIHNRRELIQEYSNDLLDKDLSPSAIHTYLAPVCKGLGINMAEIVKPLRTAGTITKTRDINKNLRGKKTLERNHRAQEIADIQSRIGIRKAELFALRGRCIFRTSNPPFTEE